MTAREFVTKTVEHGLRPFKTLSVADVHPWLLSRRQLVKMVQRDTRIIEQQGDELARAAQRERILRQEREHHRAERERLRTLLWKRAVQRANQ